MDIKKCSTPKPTTQKVVGFPKSVQNLFSSVKRNRFVGVFNKLDIPTAYFFLLGK